MSRDYAALSRGARGVFVPRWMLWTAGFALLAVLYFAAFSPPRWTIQRLESPDGKRTAVLFRTQDGSPHFAIKVREAALWRTVYTSPPITNSFREDLGERLAWSSNSATLLFRLHGSVVWQQAFGPPAPRP